MGKFSRRVKIQDVSYCLPPAVVTNEDLQRENPQWDMSAVEARTGVARRHIAAPGETALDLAHRACQQLLEKNPGLRESVDGILFCTQSPDHIMPPNSCILQQRLDLPEDLYAVDFTLACSGYIYGLALAQGLIGGSLCTNILLVTGDTYSKYIHPQDRSARVLFGDGAAVTWLTASASGEGLMDVACATSGKGYDTFIIPAGGCRLPKSVETAIPTRDRSDNIRCQENIHMDGLRILTFVNSRIPKQIKQVLDRNGLSFGDIDLFVFHQASLTALESLARLMDIPGEKMFGNLRDIGNTVSASIPIALADARRDRRISPGTTVLLCGFGVGLSWGTAICRF